MVSHISYGNWVLRNFSNERVRKLIFSALKFADKKHEGQKRRITGAPYIRHPEMVSIAVHKLRLPLAYVIAALLHDITEDCFTTRKQIELKFGKSVGDLVHFMDKKNLDHFDSPVDFENYEEKLDYFLQKDPLAILLRLSDSWNNLWEYKGYKNGERAMDAVKDTLELVRKAKKILPKNKLHANFLGEVEKLAEIVRKRTENE